MSAVAWAAFDLGVFVVEGEVGVGAADGAPGLGGPGGAADGLPCAGVLEAPLVAGSVSGPAASEAIGTIGRYGALKAGLHAIDPSMRAGGHQTPRRSLAPHSGQNHPRS